MRSTLQLLEWAPVTWAASWWYRIDGFEMPLPTNKASLVGLCYGIDICLTRCVFQVPLSVLVTKRAIEDGEELWFDYNLDPPWPDWYTPVTPQPGAL